MGIVLNALDLRSGDAYYYTYGNLYTRYYDETSLQDGTTTASKVS
jgi:hypothetical protein